MVKKCIICKAKPSSTDNRTFHMFPTNESLRKEWLDAINLDTIPNFKTAYICSEHFDEESFPGFHKYTIRRRLSLTAIPNRNIPNLSNLSSENVIEESAVRNVINCIESEKSGENSMIENENLQQNADQGAETCTDTDNESNNRKRKHSLADIPPWKRIRFMDGSKIEYMYRKDFVSDDAWNRFLKCLSYQKSKLNASHNKNSRKKKKIQYLKAVFEFCRKKRNSMLLNT